MKKRQKVNKQPTKVHSELAEFLDVFVSYNLTVGVSYFALCSEHQEHNHAHVSCFFLMPAVVQCTYLQVQHLHYCNENRFIFRSV